MVLMRLLEKAYDGLSDKSSSMISITLGIVNMLWVYFFDRFANGRITFSEPISIEQWVVTANVTLYMLVILLFLSVMFGIIGIRKALSEKGDIRWVILALIGIVLGLLPLIISGLSGRIWFRTLFL